MVYHFRQIPLSVSALLLWFASVSTAHAAFGTTECPASRFGTNLGCTANDVSITGIAVSGGPGSCVAGTSATFDLDLTVNSGTPDRYDIGIFISNDGKDPLLTPANGGPASCAVDILPPNDPPFRDLDPGPWSGVTDICGDVNGSMNGGTGTGVKTMTNVTVACQGFPGSAGKLYIPFVVSWDNKPTKNPKQEGLCTSIADPVPNTKSKCNSPTVAQGTVNVVVLPQLTNTDGITSISAGNTTIYTVVITNNTGDTLSNALFKDPAVTDLTVNSVTCTAAGGATCPTTTITDMQGAGITIPAMPVDSTVTFTINATLATTATGTLTNTASVTVNAYTNSVDDVDTIVAPLVDHFAIDVGAGNASTCTPRNITITAQDGSNALVTSYTGTVNLTTSSSHGDWLQGTATNIPDDGATSDDGAASYIFDVNDQGQITLQLENHHADDLTITVSDPALGITSTSAVLSFRDNAFVISDTDPTPATNVLVAGRDEAMQVALWRRDAVSGDCDTADAYNGNKNLKVWFTPDASHPAGAIAPDIGAVSLPTTAPVANNLTLNFNAGIATFNLSTADVGKYALNMRDDTSGFIVDQNNNTLTINGGSSTLTTRPFAIGFTNILSGTNNNPGGTASSGNAFIPADTAFSATLGGYLWSASDDHLNDAFNVANDGIPNDSDGDGIADADVTDNGLTPAFGFLTNLSSSAPFTPTGAGSVLGSLSVTNPDISDYSGGQVTPTDFKYPEVGSMTLRADVLDYLGTALADFTGYSGIVGRFHPAHFTLEAGGSVTPGCSASFTYMDQPLSNITFDIRARNNNNLVTSNYDTNRGYGVGTIIIEAENSDDGVDLSSRMSNPTANWAAGAFSVNSNSEVFIRSATGNPDGAFQNLALGIAVNDADGPVIANADMNPTTVGACLPASCSSATLATTDVRYGRMVLLNTYGSELLPLRLPIRTEYFNGTDFVENADDSCTSYNATNITLGVYTDNLNSGEVTTNGSGTLSGGKENATSPITLHQDTPSDPTKGPGLGNEGSVNVMHNTDAWLEYNWGIDCDGDTVNDNEPCAKATFGIYRGDDRVIYWREIFD